MRVKYISHIFCNVIAMALNIKAKRTRYPAIEDRYEVLETLGAG